MVINLVNDAIAERQFEDYQLVLSNVDASGLPVTLATGDAIIGSATIENEDWAEVNISTTHDPGGIDDQAWVEEELTEVVVTIYTVTPSDADIVVNLQTSSSSFTPAATVGEDYTSLNVSATIPAGTTSTTKTLVLLPDGTVEGHEWFKVEVSIVEEYDRMVRLGHDKHRDVKIVDDDYAELNISSEEVDEPASGFTDVVFTLTLSCPVAIPVTVTVSTRDGTATAGTNADYLTNSQQITFQANETTKTFTVRVYHDNVSGEGDEQFYVDLANLIAGTLTQGEDPFVKLGANSTGTGTIHD